MDPQLYAELLPLLDQPLKRGAKTWSYCPTHPDGASTGKRGGGLAGRSLSLDPQYGLECWSSRGCTFKGIIDALRARGTPKAARAPERRWAGNERADGFRLVEAYDYGLAVKGRFERANAEAEKGYDKEFAWRLPNGTFGKGIAPLKVTDMPLWGEELVAAAPKDMRIWFVEGEKAAGVLRQQGEVAVCGGWSSSTKEIPVERFECLRDRDVLLWPDNDPAGRDYMAGIRKILRPIASTVTVIHAAVPPKGDAYEWFVKQKGTVDGLLKGVVLRPSVEVVSPDQFVVRVPAESGLLVFEFDEMLAQRHALDCSLTVRVDSPVAETEPYSQRINIKSQSAREGLERALGRQFGKEVNWTVAVSTAYSRVTAAYNETDAGAHIGVLPEVSEQRWVVDGILPHGHPSILFGDGSSGKSLLAEDICASVAMGAPSWCGQRTTYGGALWIDYETDGDNGETFRLRMRRLLAGRGVEPDLYMGESGFRIHYWRGRGVPLHDQADAIRRYMEKHELDLAVIDSGGIACGGKPEDAVVALQYFNALAKIGKTSLTICHINKDDAKEGKSYKPFGSAYWHNLARRTWFVSRSQVEESDDMDVALFNRKANFGALSKPVALHAHFDGESGPITIKRQSSQVVAMIEDTLVGQIRGFLEAEGASTVAEITDALGGEAAAIRKCLERWRESQFAVVSGSGRKGDPLKWGVLSWRHDAP